MRMWARSLALLSVALSCGVGHSYGSDPSLLWLWHRLAAAALTGPLAWAFPYAAGVALKRQKKKFFAVAFSVAFLYANFR